MSDEVPQGLTRSHTWMPHVDAVRVATAAERFMDVDDYLDRYLMRCKTLDKKPNSSEWLTWLLDDDAKAKREERIQSRRYEVECDDTGTPLSWR